MATLTEFSECTQEAEPEDRPMCPIGPQGHKWELSIEEGQVALCVVDRDRCVLYQGPSGNDYVDCEGMIMVNGTEVFHMDPIPVTVTPHVETYGYYGDEVDFWWQIDFVRN
jgi:hypothetical protein